MNTRDFLVAFSVRHNGDWEKIYQDVQNKTIVPDKEIETAINIVNNAGLNFITILDEGYPDALKNCYRPPFVVYYKGDISLLNSDKIKLGIYGTREPSMKLFDYIETIFRDDKLCKDNFIFIDGNSNGTQREINLFARTNKIKTILVLPNGFDCAYPRMNEDILDYTIKNGLVLSEYPFGEPKAGNFVPRNRIINALSNKIVCFEFISASGTMLAINEAVGSNKDVYVVPTPIKDYFYNNEIIKRGANILTCVDDLLS